MAKLSVEAPVLRTKKVTRNGLAPYIQKVLLAYCPTLAPQFMEAILRGVINDDRDILKLAAEMLGLTSKGSGGGIVINNLNSQVNATAINGPARSFDAIARQISQERDTVEITQG